MATHVDKSPVTRQVRGLGFGDLIVTMASDGIYIREKGKRTTFGPLSWDSIYRRAAELAARRAADEKPKRAKRRVSRGLLTTGR